MHDSIRKSKNYFTRAEHAAPISARTGRISALLMPADRDPLHRIRPITSDTMTCRKTASIRWMDIEQCHIEPILNIVDISNHRPHHILVSLPCRAFQHGLDEAHITINILFIVSHSICTCLFHINQNIDPLHAFPKNQFLGITEKQKSPR